MTTRNEFWRDIPPIADVFKPDAKPEVHIANAPTDDISPTRLLSRATRWCPTPRRAC